MLDKVINTCNKSNKLLTMEIGSNSDLILENTITGNLKWTIENFANTKHGYLTFPTKFDMVDDILDAKHNNVLMKKPITNNIVLSVTTILFNNT